MLLPFTNGTPLSISWPDSPQVAATPQTNGMLTNFDPSVAQDPFLKLATGTNASAHTPVSVVTVHSSIDVLASSYSFAEFRGRLINLALSGFSVPPHGDGVHIVDGTPAHGGRPNASPGFESSPGARVWRGIRLGPEDGGTANDSQWYLGVLLESIGQLVNVIGKHMCKSRTSHY